MTTRPTPRIAALLAAATTLVGAFAACGDTNTTVINANCGAGTTLKDGVCVPVTDATTDTGVADTGAEVPDSSGRSDGSSDGSPGDAAADAAPDTDDPCPTPPAGFEFINCDATCGEVNQRCQNSWCLPTDEDVRVSNGVKSFGGPMLGFTDPHVPIKVMVRMPRNPSEKFGSCGGPRAPFAPGMQFDGPATGGFEMRLAFSYSPATFPIVARARGYKLRPFYRISSLARPSQPDLYPPQAPPKILFQERERNASLDPRLQDANDCRVLTAADHKAFMDDIDLNWKPDPTQSPPRPGNRLGGEQRIALFPNPGVGARNITVIEAENGTCP